MIGSAGTMRLIVVDPIITPEMIAIWRRLRSIVDAGDDERWESEGGRRREALDLDLEMHRLLGLKPHQMPPILALCPKAPRWMSQTRQWEDYRRAHLLSRRLDEAAERVERAERRGKARPRRPHAAGLCRPPTMRTSMS